jgi:hypothetical protein
MMMLEAAFKPCDRGPLFLTIIVDVNAPEGWVSFDPTFGRLRAEVVVVLRGDWGHGAAGWGIADESARSVRNL